MMQPGGSIRARAERLLARRRARLERLLGRPLPPARGQQVPSDRRRFLLEEAEELYWNELAWESLTSEERDSSELVELTFPGFLAFVDGLLLREVMPDSPTPASPRPQVVEDILCFLAERVVERQDADARNADQRQAAYERQATERLLDLVLYRLHMIPVQTIDRLGLGAVEGDET